MAEALKHSIAFVGIDISSTSLDSMSAVQCAAAEVVAGPSGSTVREYAAMSDWNGSLRRRIISAAGSRKLATMPG
jgi:hypothetical protein